MSTLRKIDTRIPRTPLLWLAAALVFTVPPMFGTLSPWVPALFLVTLALKFWMEPKGYRLRLALWKLILTTAALAAIFFSYGSLKGIEPGVSLIVVLMSLKMLEAHTAREFHVMVMVAWVLCLCGFFLAQDLSIALCLLIAFALLLVALLQFHRGPSRNTWWPPLRTAGILILQALPVTALLFLFFPRVSTGFRLLMTPSSSAAAGFSDRMSPGGIASLASSTEVAFRAEFPDGKIPRADVLYWRGVVMSAGAGMEWRARQAPAALSPSALRPPAAETTRQRITIEPHGEHWMFALDWPVQPPPGALLAPGNYLWSYQSIRKSRRYEVRSFAQHPDKNLRQRERDALLEVPPSISPRARELAQSWVAANADPRVIVISALQFFRAQGFRYSLSPGEYRKNDLDEFLFERRVGFCEHYAASFATLMRLAGVPARVVVGYLGGEYNEFGRFLLVRQSDTHAWCEVWLPEVGWTRVDPTSVVAPDRVNLGFDSFLERRGPSAETNTGAFARGWARQPIFTNLRLAWQTLNYTWDTRVLSFDAETQEAFVANVDLTRVPPLQLSVSVLLGAGALYALFVGGRHFRTRSREDRVKGLYEKFCRKAARRGAVREAWEGPAHFANRAMTLLPNESERIGRLIDAYLKLRYSTQVPAGVFEDLTREVGAFPRGKQ
ncbi:MAG: DUF3488 and DUF4129 domain-containing transglutaminase family protein [Verrucomicrobiota bacterium]|nr:DUF3488 and DUF4129 domain-containing transglutaminase family protein [Verrucomicrobiota bacterium]